MRESRGRLRGGVFYNGLKLLEEKNRAVYAFFESVTEGFITINFLILTSIMS